jgi:radical SAM-linked protein
MYKINFTFSKKEKMIFISHLDLMRLFMRALRRASLPIKMTEGFSPHPKISLKRALKLGVASENEEATFVLRESVSPEEFKERLQEQLPAGIYLNQVYTTPL